MKYGLASAGMIGLVVALTALVLGGPGATGVAVAGVIAFPVQMLLFAVMSRVRVGTNAFLAAWVGGMLARLVVVGLVALVVTRSSRLPEVPTLLGLAGFFLMMVLVEPLFLGLRAPRGARELRSE